MATEYILIVEDDFNIRDSLKEIFELAGYNTFTCSNGREGYNSILEDCPDLVICDVNMPELDGFGLLTAINQKFKDKIVPPFVFLTAKVEQENKQLGMSLGADDYILKPFDTKYILETVRMRLDRRKTLLNQSESVARLDAPKLLINKLALPSEEGLTLVAYSEIIKCEADRAYCSFHLASGKTILVSKSMSEFEDLLVSNGFIKVHKSTIVNIQYIEKYIRGKGGHVVLTCGSLVSVSSRKKEELMKILRV